MSVNFPRFAEGLYNIVKSRADIVTYLEWFVFTTGRRVAIVRPSYGNRVKIVSKITSPFYLRNTFLVPSCCVRVQSCDIRKAS